MGRLEPMTALALGRGMYEDGVVEGTGETPPGGQQYNDHGHPRNPETRRKEREGVRAANEVMQVTGVVEDSLTARLKEQATKIEKNEETFTGLRLMEVGRAALVGGVWGVLGLRRRVLIYKPYSDLSMLGILRQEMAVHSLPGLLFSGLPTVIAYHISDWMGFLGEAFMDEVLFDDSESKLSPRQLWLKHTAQIFLDIGFCYVTLHFRMFAILQQLNLIPGTRLLPSFKSFLPFAAQSPLRLPPPPSSELSSLLSWGSSLFSTAAPILIILVHGKLKYLVSRILYRPIYKCLPRPTGDSMFSGIPDAAPPLEYDAPDRNSGGSSTVRGEDPQTLRALEGLPAVGQPEERVRIQDIEQESSEEDDEEMAHATLITFDIEATEAADSTLGTWSAELRSANEPKQSRDVKYRVTGLTLLPTILATEGLREILAGLVVMPLEAVMVRTIARAYRQSAGLSVSDLYQITQPVRGFENLFLSFALQMAVTGVVWAGFTVGSQWWAAGKKLRAEMVGDTHVEVD